MISLKRRRLQLPETFAFTTIGVFTVASFACGTSGTGATSSASAASSSTGMGGATSSSSSSSSSIASSSSGSSTCTPDGGMCVMADAGNQQTIFGCVDFGLPYGLRVHVGRLPVEL